MSTDISKLCADFIRGSYLAHSGEKLKASHAREMVAAFFGYKSHAALIAEQKYPLSQLNEATILVPDILLLDKRQTRLNGLPKGLWRPHDLSARLSAFLKDEGYFGGEIWLYESLENYIMEVFLVENDHLILDELSGTMAETNAYFDEAYYESATVSYGDDDVIVEVDGTYYGSNDQDKLFSGDKIDMSVTVTLYRMAGKIGFLRCELSAGGSVNDDWVDPDLRHGAPVSASSTRF